MIGRAWDRGCTTPERSSPRRDSPPSGGDDARCCSWMFLTSTALSRPAGCCGIPAGLAVGTSGDKKREGVMLWTVAVILFVLWALGMGTAYTGGGLVHFLLVIAAIVIVYQFLAGRRTVWRRRDAGAR